MAALHFPPTQASNLAPYLPPISPTISSSKPWVTLTYATSLDASISLSPGTQTHLSGAESKAMTHFLRSRHDAILVGVGTAVADDPGLNCRLEGFYSHPRPVVLDPNGRWDWTRESKVIRLAREGKGLGPWILVGRGAEVGSERRTVLEEVGGKVVVCEEGFGWEGVLGVLGREGMKSVMVEGGGKVINSLLGTEGRRWVDSVAVTIAPVWLGTGGVVVSPEREVREAVSRLRGVRWCPMGEDVVLCGFP